MKWSLRIATVAGIGIFVHWTFVILLAWVAFVELRAGATVTKMFIEIGFVMGIFVCVVLHELGHALAARGFGIRTRDITLLPIGGVARLERMPEKPLQELWVAVAGPLVNVVIAATLLVGIVLATGLRIAPNLDLLSGNLVVRLMAVNVALVVFNMIPAFPMDGGRVLRAILATAMPFVKATRVAAGVGQVLAIVFALVGIWIGQPFLLFIALFVFLGAQAEAEAAEARSSLSGLRVRDAMLTRFRTLHEDDPLQMAVEELLSGSQADFPVVTDGHVAGVVTRTDLVKALAERGPGGRIGDVMRRDCGAASADAPLEAALGALHGCPLVPVTDHGQLVGMLTPENVSEAIMVRAAMKSRPG